MRTAALRLTLALAMGPLTGCDAGTVEHSGGDLLTDTVGYEALDYALTSDNYNRWLRAQRALDSMGVRIEDQLDIRSVDEGDIDRATRSLEARPDARAAIESADMRVRDFVLTSVALAQSWDAVNGPAARVLGARPDNLAFLRAQSEAGGARPATGIVRDDAGSADSDSDSDRGRGRGKARGKRNGRGKHRD